MPGRAAPLLRIVENEEIALAQSFANSTSAQAVLPEFAPLQVQGVYAHDHDKAVHDRLEMEWQIYKDRRQDGYVPPGF